VTNFQSERLGKETQERKSSQLCARGRPGKGERETLEETCRGRALTQRRGIELKVRGKEDHVEDGWYQREGGRYGGLTV